MHQLLERAAGDARPVVRAEVVHVHRAARNKAERRIEVAPDALVGEEDVPEIVRVVDLQPVRGRVVPEILAIALGSVTTLPQGAVPTGGFAALTEDALRYSHVQPDPERSYVEHWNVNVQRELPASVVMQLGCVGQRGVHLPFRAGDANVVVPTETEQGLTWPTPRASGTRLNTGVGIINTLAWISSSSYHAMTLQVSRTRARQRVGLSYTWSKSIDTSSSTIASDYNNSIQSPLLFFPEALRGLSDFVEEC
jgi:hypothetical protein